MKLLFSIPTGYHLRELVMPLKAHLESTGSIERVYGITPGAPYVAELFPTYSGKFEFHANPDGVEAHKTLFETLRPDVVITNTVGHDELDYPILKAAQELNIPTVTFIASWDNIWKIGRLMNDGKPVAVADNIIVWNTMMKEHFHRLFPDVADDRVTIVGAPRMDYFWHEDRIPSKEAVYRNLCFEDASRPLIHFSTTELYPMDYVIKTVRQAIDAGQITGNPYVYASVHPGGNMSKHKSLEQYGAVVRYSPGRRENPPVKSFAYNATQDDVYNLVGVFKHASLLVNHSSTTALESLIAGTPVINVKYGSPMDWWKWYRSMVYRDFQQHYIDLIKDGATTVVTAPKQLVQSIQSKLQNPNQDKAARASTVKRMITTTDGTASEKVLEHIISTAE